ncbi:PorP/SprF family type IX secretion system membrane protein [Chitinophaga polysaccharea]|uniref:PorP/SprF family type IX secretion system membrane protein n=1 Tax=Chitinophaga polysaccharea TaxID=1293035 RepID=UPI00163D05B1|nr:type IX secretion system membrane protein PorP/SprF [Chitinophaga polysaccharea]
MLKFKFLKSIITGGIFLGSLTVQAQQAAQFSQYMFHGLFINPAYAGYREQLNLTGVYRNQWTGVEGAPNTASLAVDGTVNDDKVGLGLNVISDKLGAASTLGAYANFAYRIKFDSYEGVPRTLAIGVAGGITQQSLDGSKLNPYDETADLRLLNQRKTITMPDARVGILYNTDRFYAGVSADNIGVQFIKPKKDPNRLLPETKINIYMLAGYLFPLSEELAVRPSMMLKNAMAGPSSLDLNAYLLIQQIVWVGAGYRTGVTLFNKNIDPKLEKPSALIIGAQFYLGDQFRIGYTYDRSLKTTAKLGPSSHEISIGFLFPRRDQQMLTPRFF